MQLNLHVPKDRERLLGRLERAARLRGKPKSQVVLDALERYLEEDAGDAGSPGETMRLPVYHMGVIEPFRRADIYGDSPGPEQV
jgi:hypothetical protein